MKLLSPELWLRQAKADEAASRSKSGLAECHRRYLLQQAYEKAVKALALACLTKTQTRDGQFTSALGDCFLHHHTPMTVFSTKDENEWKSDLQGAYKGNWQKLLKELKTLRQRVATEMGADADVRIVNAWKKIDATRPSKVVDAVSYRYPFVDTRYDQHTVPAEYKDWATYQGKEDLVREAIAKLLERAGRQVARSDAFERP